MHFRDAAPQGTTHFQLKNLDHTKGFWNARVVFWKHIRKGNQWFMWCGEYHSPSGHMSYRWIQVNEEPMQKHEFVKLP